MRKNAEELIKDTFIKNIKNKGRNIGIREELDFIHV